MISKVIHGSSMSDIQSKLEATIANVFHPTLAIVFGSSNCQLEELPTIFTKFGISVVGASTAGEFTGEITMEDQIVVMLMDMDKESFKVFSLEADFANSFVAGKKLGRFAKSTFNDPSFLLFFTMNTSGESLIAGVNDELSSNAPVFGGMAGDNMKMVKTVTFSNEYFSAEGITALVIDNEKVEMKGHALCGWQPVGVEHQITAAKDNIIYAINNKPALDIVKKYFGDYYDNTLEEGAVAMGAAQYPLQIRRGESSVLRVTLIANEEDGSLMMAGPVQKGDKFKFSTAPGFEVIDETVKGFEDYHKANAEADALILISCKARHMSLGPLLQDEISGIYKLWEKPMAGFFSYGEVGQHGTGTSYFYNETCSLVLLKERNQVRTKNEL